MEISVDNVRFTMLSDPGKPTKAMCGFRLNGILFVTGCKVIESAKGRFLAFPSRKVEKDGQAEYKDICFPASKEARDAIQAAVLAEYDKQTGSDIEF